MPSSGL